jgi:putative addiction module component (TIGR02574 family)
MARDVTELFREASQLPESERADLAGRLLQSLHGEAEADLEAAWAEEIERRVGDIDSGAVTTIAWEDVRAKLYARLNGRS